MRFKRILGVFRSFAQSDPEHESQNELKRSILGTLAIHADHKIKFSYDTYLALRHNASLTNREAVSFLDDVAKQDPQCDSLAFDIFETLIRALGQKIDEIVEEDCYSTWCSNIRNAMQNFLLLMAENLSSIRQPFSPSVEELVRRDSGVRDILAWFNRQSCCSTKLSCDLPDEQHFLLNQLLILSLDEQPSLQETITTCEVCYDQDAKPRKLRPDCQHEGGVCLECLAKAITTQMERKRWNELTCPLCPAILDSNTVEKYAPEETVRRYQMYMVSDTLKDEPRYRKCLRTTCQMGQIHEAGDAEPLMTCIACGFKMCYIHSRSWHSGQTCSQYEASQRHQKENERSSQLIKRVTKRCPGRGCNVPIEKNDGCDHMTCYTCRHEFCWHCLAPFGPIRKHGNEGHRPTCRYHSGNLPAAALLTPQRFFPNG